MNLNVNVNCWLEGMYWGRFRGEADDISTEELTAKVNAYGEVQEERRQRPLWQKIISFIDPCRDFLTSDQFNRYGEILGRKIDSDRYKVYREVLEERAKTEGEAIQEGLDNTGSYLKYFRL
ncbi:hypothetical protein CMI42_01245 [Candidatus Pacearchaeota archaeon]|nr:hypothetical protein [Candidatus Pacearchaeota archaeon]|tara:strand:- start:472 stop:834 length:363 start_codon:yes stop_codon:yes gene_type:complete